MLKFDGYCRGNFATFIVYCGFRLPIFAPFVYQYISTGTLESTLHLLQLDDITNFDVRQVCEMVVIFLYFLVIWYYSNGEKFSFSFHFAFDRFCIITWICPTLDVA